MDGVVNDRRTSVLRALRDRPGGVSGEALAVELGVSRVAVRKHVEALRKLGYRIDARVGEGYHLRACPDSPLPFEVGPLLQTDFYTRLEGGGETGSTNDDARTLAMDGAPEGTVVLASAQRTGRGRLGRAWASPAGGVYASIVLRPEVELPDGVVLPLVVGIGVARGLAHLGADVLLKWPNDVLAPDGRKIAGLLLEGLSEGWRVAWVVAGIGLNVHCIPADHDAVCVDTLVGRSVGLGEAGAVVLDGVAGAYREWSADGFEPLREEYERLSWLRGRTVRVTDAAGHVFADGIAEGIDAQGRLLVAGADGVTAVAAGDVTLRDKGREGDTA
jgi:BirA family transcriptional regulator, biotin operon repressor / biotin---[acetyl-CoA-carboxylase] ligase